jgi:hypothetical protein
MRKIYLFLLVFSFLGCLINPLWSSEDEKIEERQIAILASTFHYFDHQQKDQVWPLFSLLSYPAIFHFKNGHLYGFGFKQPLSYWKTKIAHPIPVLFKSDPQEPLLQVTLDPFYLIEEKPAFVFGLIHEEDFDFKHLLLFIQEKFRVFQSTMFKPEQKQKVKKSDYQNTSQLAWIELENRLLTRALETPLAEERRSFLKDYLAVNQKRRQQLSRESIQTEDSQQRMEGLAAYVSLRSYQIFPAMPQFDFEKMVLKLRAQTLIKQPTLPYDAMEKRHVFVGTVLGWALDLYAQPNWKYAIQYRQFTLQQLLERALTISLPEREKRLDYLKNQEEWRTLQQQIQWQLEKEKMNDQRVMELFDQKEGYIVWLGLPSIPTYTKGYQRQLSQVHHLKVLKEVTLLCTTHNSLWRLSLKNAPLCIEEQTGERAFKVPLGLKLVVDGQELTFKTMQQLPQPILFRTLTWKNSLCDFETICSGRIFIQPQTLQISFDQ